MPTWLEGRPFALVFLVLYVIGTARGQLTYGIARWTASQTIRRTDRSAGWPARVNGWLDGAEVARGRRAIERWGLPVIPLAYLTVGFQTMVLAACGVLRVHWLRFTLAQIPGALAWALIYATIGFAAWEAAIGAAAGSPLAIALLGVLFVVGVTRWMSRRTARRKAGMSDARV
ncbi:VTT domain-containing protein [Marihabitans asiaticum]|uniref:Membrane protein DedA with SNARE-associated domain n=1 Tax=Marihabitans asiaticum TaxID=415218 RepID=A0A560WGL8_9MICO|nr:VTT domain-containing protein [Marihabitans asiaticum]TWD16831.1 membrane protein DedA with SNARE-associated domain [Marihabitans asiaticum]